MRAVDANVQTTLDSTNDQVVFVLNGGTYLAAAVGTWGGGSLTLEALGPDGTTWITVGTAITADGSQVYSLTHNQYRWTIVTATAVAVSIARVPGE